MSQSKINDLIDLSEHCEKMLQSMLPEGATPLEYIENLVAAEWDRMKKRDKMVDIHEAARILHISESTIYKKVSAGEIPYSKPFKEVSFRRGDLEDIIAKSRRLSTSEMLNEAAALLARNGN